MVSVRKCLSFAGASACIAAIVAVLPSSPALSQQPKELRIAHFVASAHPIGMFFEKWAKELEEKSGGRLKFTILPGAQLGPTPNYYDIARRGQADITWVLHGATPNRFPLVEISNLPFLFCSGEHASKVLNHPELRSKYFDAEHQGVKVLNIHAHVPGHLWLSRNTVTKLEDLKGKAIRPASRTLGAFVSAVNARSVGLPPDQLAENMEKGTIDGTFMDYPAGSTSFKLGPVTKHIVEMNAYTTSFSFVMNQDSWNGLPDDLKKLIEESLVDRQKDIGGGWDALNDRALETLKKGGTEVSRLPASEFAKLQAIGQQVSKEWTASLDARGLPGTQVYSLIRKLAEETKASSANFCFN